MTFGLVFWILMLLWLVFEFWGFYSPPADARWRGWGSSFFLFILFLLLGWKVFGAPIHP